MIIMRVLVISDTHRTLNKIVSLLKDIKDDIDAVIHLGDNVEDADFIKRNYKLPVYYVAGNCDYNGSALAEQVFELGGKVFYITHGHYYDVKYDQSSLVYRGMEVGADICLFGHTHEPYLEVIKNIVVMNPGSLAFPRGGSKESYGIIKIEDNEIYPTIVGRR